MYPLILPALSVGGGLHRKSSSLESLPQKYKELQRLNECNESFRAAMDKSMAASMTGNTLLSAWTTYYLAIVFQP